MQFPIRRHRNCQDSRCLTCLADHERLAAYIARETGGLTRGRELECYRLWLDLCGIPAESHGWASDEAFSEATVKLFVNDRLALMEQDEKGENP
jgi:hypothetical protein